MALSWQASSVELLRVLINDLEDTPTYSDERLQRVLVVSALQVGISAKFSQNYTVNILKQTIIPDPTDVDGGTADINYVNLMCIKAACIIDTGSAILAANNAVAGKDMMSAFDLKDVAKSTLALLEKGWCNTFEEALGDYLNGSGVISAAVMSPFRIHARNFGIAYPFQYFNLRSY